MKRRSVKTKKASKSETLNSAAPPQCTGRPQSAGQDHGEAKDEQEKASVIVDAHASPEESAVMIKSKHAVITNL